MTFECRSGCQVARETFAKRSLIIYLSHFLFIQIAINLQRFDPVTLTNPHIVGHWRILFQTLGVLLASTMVALAFEFSVQQWIDRARANRCSTDAKGRGIPSGRVVRPVGANAARTSGRCSQKGWTAEVSAAI